MSQVIENKEYRTFVKGLITEANPLTFPENSSKDEDNFVLNRAGGRRRRQGLDYEQSYTKNKVTYDTAQFPTAAVTMHLWNNVNNNPDLKFYVLQLGTKLYFSDALASSPSSNLINSGDPIEVDGIYDYEFQFQNVKGFLVLVTGDKVIYRLSYDQDTDMISVEKHGLLVRDLWGVDDGFNPEDSVFPETCNSEHVYNLLNQGFAQQYGEILASKPSLISPNGFLRGKRNLLLMEYLDQAPLYYPSNAAQPKTGIDSSDSDKFKVTLLERATQGNNYAPKGFYILDVFFRGTSRLLSKSGESILKNFGAYKGETEWGNGCSGAYKEILENGDSDVVTALIADQGGITEGVTIDSLPTDSSEGGIKNIASYAGRLFYTGFSPIVTDGDSESPRLSSYIFFSQVIKNESDIGKCYQEGDPTSAENFDLVDNDGGFIIVPDMATPVKIVPMANSLVVLADNGVWSINGGDSPFSATNFEVKKLSDIGCISAKSVVEAEDGLMFWSEAGIYQAKYDPQSFSIGVNNITQTTIQTLYNEIPNISKYFATGVYDSAQKVIKWMYNDNEDYYANEEYPYRFNRQLNLDLTIGSFYPYTFNELNSEFNVPHIAGIFKTPEFININEDLLVVDSNDNFVVDSLGNQVIVESTRRGQSFSTTKYLVIQEIDYLGSGNYYYTFAELNNSDFNDWASEDGVGIDSPAFLSTGFEILGDSQRKKQSVYLTTTFERTETGFDPDLNLENPSSCLVSSYWDFADNIVSGKISSQFQTYRLHRFYVPTGPSDSYEYGHSVVSTKSKLRGRGKALSLRFETEPGKDCVLHGWGIVFTGNTGV